MDSLRRKTCWRIFVIVVVDQQPALTSQCHVPCIFIYDQVTHLCLIVGIFGSVCFRSLLGNRNDHIFFALGSSIYKKKG